MYLDAGVTDGGPVLRQATWTVDAGQKLVVHVDVDFASAADAKAALEWWRKAAADSALASVKAAADGTKLRLDTDYDIGNELLQKLIGTMLDVDFMHVPEPPAR